VFQKHKYVDIILSVDKIDTADYMFSYMLLMERDISLKDSN